MHDNDWIDRRILKGEGEWESPYFWEGIGYIFRAIVWFYFIVYLAVKWILTKTIRYIFGGPRG